MKLTKKEKAFMKEFYNNEPKKICHWCGVTEEKCKAYFEKHPECTRGGRRGYKLEVGRIDSSKSHNKENCVLACYVCNNAKSNFDKEFFEPIAQGIRKAWEKEGGK